MLQIEVRELLLKSIRENKGPQDLFPQLARNALFYYIPKDEEAPDNFKYFVKSGDQTFVLLFTDEEVLNNHFQSLGISTGVQTLHAGEALKRVIRKGFDGIIINTGHESQMVLDIKLLKLLFREHLLVDFYVAEGVWVLFKENQLLLFEAVKGVQTIPVYYTENEARKGVENFRFPLSVSFLPWKQLLEFCTRSKVNHLVYQFNEPEMTFISEPYLSWLYKR